MLHKKLIESRLGDLDENTATYFSSIADRLQEDPRTQASPNLVFLVLKETLPYLPTYLPPDSFMDTLFAFVDRNHAELRKIIYGREYVEDVDIIRPVTDQFINDIMKEILTQYGEGELEVGESSEYRFNSTDDEFDFPYVDMDED